jgi:hypothetical protein
VPADRDPTTAGPRPPRVAVCVDLDDDVEVIRGIHRNFVLDRGHLVLTAAPATSADDLIRAMLITLNVLWRLPAKLRPGGVSLNEEGRAIAEWEISWALTRVAGGCRVHVVSPKQQQNPRNHSLTHPRAGTGIRSRG